MDALTNTPIEDCEPHVDSNGGLPARLLDQGTDLDQQFPGGSAVPSQICLRHPYPFTMFIPILVTPWSWIKGYRWSGGEHSGSCVRVSPGNCATGCCTIVGVQWKSFGLLPHGFSPVLRLE